MTYMTFSSIITFITHPTQLTQLLGYHTKIIYLFFLQALLSWSQAPSNGDVNCQLMGNLLGIIS